ncbi:hypothetical protein SHIRM173S_07088 [Streptomyces hirsutus]
MAEPFGFKTVDEAIASTTEGLRFFMSHGIDAALHHLVLRAHHPARQGQPAGRRRWSTTSGCSRPTARRWTTSVWPRPPATVSPDLGRAVFSVSSFMDSLPAQEPAEA